MTFHPNRVVVGAAITAFSLTAVLSIAPPKPANGSPLRSYISSHAQTLDVGATDAPAAVTRDGYTASAGTESLVAGGTNYDWAKLVLLDGHFPVTDANVTVFTRWMRQENGANDWWNRNNPLNNGLGSGGGGGTGTYANLQVSAQYLADNLRRPIFAGIAQEFDAQAPTADIESAIWASAWATSHYADGTHWHYTPVDVVSAPAGAWG
jgi:hypothetical protein